jgi:hypothetical protein
LPGQIKEKGMSDFMRDRKPNPAGQESSSAFFHKTSIEIVGFVSLTAYVHFEPVFPNLEASIHEHWTENNLCDSALLRDLF